MIEQKIVDHLFRHQYGRMVSILTRIFGLSQLETIEDAIQDTFVNAMLAWRNKMPDNPEAWLTQAAKNRAIDLLRKIKAEQNRIGKLSHGASAMVLNDLFLEHEIEDSQLRMIFTACHPALNPKDQIAFALKTISGFSTKEVASALLLKEETIKKRLTRARKAIVQASISFEIPDARELPLRLERVLEVIYLTFNEGFHSNNKKILIRKELCGEAIRLCRLILKRENLRSGALYALFALLCFHAARLDSKVNEQNEIVDLKNQDRSKWYAPLIQLGHNAMNRAVEGEEFSSYHFEAAIAAEHLKACTFDSTNWDKILHWYERLHELQASATTKLNIAIVQLQRQQAVAAFELLQQIQAPELEQRAYLLYGCYAEYYIQQNQFTEAIDYLDQALLLVRNDSERAFLMKKKMKLLL